MNQGVERCGAAYLKSLADSLFKGDIVHGISSVDEFTTTTAEAVINQRNVTPTAPREGGDALLPNSNVASFAAPASPFHPHIVLKK
jgi:hypothetical protein